MMLHSPFGMPEASKIYPRKYGGGQKSGKEGGKEGGKEEQENKSYTADRGGV